MIRNYHDSKRGRLLKKDGMLFTSSKKVEKIWQICIFGEGISMRHSPHLCMCVTLQSIDRWQNWHHEYWLETAHMAPGPVLLWSRSQSKLELGTNPFLCPALWAASCVTRIILLPPSTDTFPREISTRANSHFLPSQIRPTHTCQY